MAVRNADVRWLAGKRSRIVVWGLVLLLATAGVLAVWRFRYKLRPLYHLARAVLSGSSVTGSGDFTNVLFIHHSVGQNLIAQGHVRERFAEARYDLWDHNYNHIGLTRPDGSRAGYSYNIPDDNTDPDGYAEIFSQRRYSLPLNAFSAIMQHEVIVFKSCFPTSDISDSGQLEAYRNYYLGIREVTRQHPDHLFIALAPPPLAPEATSPENAARAREFADWLASDDYLTGQANLYVFDLFDRLAEDDPSSPERNMLRQEYRPEQEGDSHPNALANETIGPQLFEFVIQKSETYRKNP